MYVYANVWQLSSYQQNPSTQNELNTSNFRGGHAYYGLNSNNIKILYSQEESEELFNFSKRSPNDLYQTTPVASDWSVMRTYVSKTQFVLCMKSSLLSWYYQVATPWTVSCLPILPTVLRDITSAHIVIKGRD